MIHKANSKPSIQFFQSHRKVYDSVYGFISFPKQIWYFIDTPHFQRLRYIKQLGCLSWVFPGACHTRFQHSLGTGYLAQKFITTLIETHRNIEINQHVYNQYFEPNKSKQAIFTVTLAGVLHDIGHGPFSHLFDQKVIQKIIKIDDNKQITWEHQIASLCLIDSIYQYLKKQKIFQDGHWILKTKDRVKALIIGKVTKGQYDKEKKQFIYKDEDNLSQQIKKIFNDQLKIRPWEFQLVSNRITGLDVDKLDYFRRDAHYLGAKNIFIDHQLLMNQALILDTKEGELNNPQRHRICFPTKYAEKVYDVFYSRYKLYKTFYHSLKANGVDFMIAQILKYAQPKFKFRQACQLLYKKQVEYENYIRLTDSILERIEDTYQLNKQQIVRINEDTSALKTEEKEALLSLQKSFKILQQLKKRQIYPFIKQLHQYFTQKDIQDGKLSDIKKEIQKNVKKKFENQQNNIIIDICIIGFGLKDRNPLLLCKFYDKTHPKKKKEIIKQNDGLFSMLRPEPMIELSIRIYLKQRQKKLSIQKNEQICELQVEIQKQLNKFLKLRQGQCGTYTNQSQKQAKDERQEIQKSKDEIKDNKQIINTEQKL